MEEYIVQLSCNPDYEEYNIKSDNTASISVCRHGEDITKGSIIRIELSKNGLIGLGTELIRAAFNHEENFIVEMFPSEKDFRVEYLGVYLTPDSPRVILESVSSKPIKEYF